MPTKQTEKRRDGEPRPSSAAHGVLIALIVIGVLLALWLVVLLKPVVMLVLISAVLAAGLAPMVARLEKLRVRGRPVRRTLAILITYILAAVVLLGAVVAVVVPLVQESIKFSRYLPGYLDATKDWLADIHRRYPSVPDYAGLLDRARSQLGEIGKYALSSVGAAFGVFGGVVSVISVIVMTAYMLSSHEDIRRSLLSLVPPRHEQQAAETMGKMSATLGGWLRGQLILAAIIGVASGLATWALGVRYPFVVGVVGAIAELVPMLGPFAAAVPAVLLLLFAPIWKLVVAVVFFAVLAQVEGNYLSPWIMRKQVGLSPLVTIIALLAGVTLLGVVGALLAVPIAAALQVLFVEVIAPAIRTSHGGRDR